MTFYRDVLGFEEAWREGEDTVSFYVPDSSAQIMLVTDGLPAGPMYLVADAQHGLLRMPTFPCGCRDWRFPAVP